MSNLEIRTISVLGGWQTGIVDGEHTYFVGPVDNETRKVWDWQKRVNLHVGPFPTPPASNGDKFYAVIASLFQACINCDNGVNPEWYSRHGARIDELVKEYAPSGSGFDNGTQFDYDASKPDRLVFTTAFHHMEEGMYSGWTEHSVIVTPSLALGVDIRVTGKNKNDIKQYIGEMFSLLGEVLIPRPHHNKA